MRLVLVGGLVISTVTGIALYIQNSALRADGDWQEQLALQLQAQLLNQAELSERRETELENSISELERTIRNLELNSLAQSNTITELEQKASPNYDQMLADARRLVAEERRQGRGSNFAEALSRPENAERMARFRVNDQFGEFLDKLGGGTTKIQAARDLLIEITSARLQLSQMVRNGEISARDATALGSDEYLVNAMASVLSEEEVQAFDDFQSDSLRRNLSRVLQNQLNEYAPTLDEATQAEVLEILTIELMPSMNTTSYSMPDRLTMKDRLEIQLEAYNRMRDSVSPHLTTQQRLELEEFIEAKTVGLEIGMDAYAELEQ